MQKTIAITYEEDALDEIGPFLPYIEEAISRGIALAQSSGAPVDVVRVTRFVDYEDPDFVEVVITFYSSAEAEKRYQFSPMLSEKVGKWSQTWPDQAKEFFCRVAIDFTGAEFLTNV